jgi:hypothetical protein
MRPNGDPSGLSELAPDHILYPPHLSHSVNCVVLQLAHIFGSKRLTAVLEALVTSSGGRGAFDPYAEDNEGKGLTAFEAVPGSEDMAGVLLVFVRPLFVDVADCTSKFQGLDLAVTDADRVWDTTLRMRLPEEQGLPWSFVPAGRLYTLPCQPVSFLHFRVSASASAIPHRMWPANSMRTLGSAETHLRRLFNDPGFLPSGATIGIYIWDLSLFAHASARVDKPHHMLSTVDMRLFWLLRRLSLRPAVKAVWLGNFQRYYDGDTKPTNPQDLGDPPRCPRDVCFGAALGPDLMPRAGFQRRLPFRVLDRRTRWIRFRMERARLAQEHAGGRLRASL